MAYTGFTKLKGELAHRKSVANPAGLAAVIGARKYGGRKMTNAAKAGRSLRNDSVNRKYRG